MGGVGPEPASCGTAAQQQAAQRALHYMGLTPGTAVRDIAVEVVFIGSCTNGRLADLRAAAGVLKGRKVSAGVRAIVVPGSARVKAEAEAEGLDAVFMAAGVERGSVGRSVSLCRDGGPPATPGRSGCSGRGELPSVAGAGRRDPRRSPARRAA